uniref:hypothetical protein n=1 Tax=Psychrobacter sp. TaxID=56811 RepID=UPI001597C386|nr:hypothetical protein [Psychrobacter sp.]QJS05445.1 hypothetical protein [Psychrobacter sp.]
MSILNKFETIEATHMKGEGSLTDVFTALAKIDSNEEFEELSSKSETKVTSLRLNVDLLDALDGVSKRFNLTRTEAFNLAVHSFFDVSINGYALGSIDHYIQQGVAPFDAFHLSREELIEGLDCSETAKEVVRNSTRNDALKKAKELI